MDSDGKVPVEPPFRAKEGESKRATSALHPPAKTAAAIALAFNGKPTCERVRRTNERIRSMSRTSTPNPS
jgi:hypothetical protein